MERSEIARLFKDGKRPFAHMSTSSRDVDSLTNQLSSRDSHESTKRLRPSPFSMQTTPTTSMTGHQTSEITPYMQDVITEDERFEAYRQGSQNLMNAMSISQRETEEYTQTMDQSPSTVLIRLLLHQDADRSITDEERENLKLHSLYCIELDRIKTVRVKLGREEYQKVFGADGIGSINPALLSRRHCFIDVIAENERDQYGVFIVDKSRNGIRLDGKVLQRDQRYRLCHGQTITLLSSRNGTVLIGYNVEDPHIRAIAAPSRPLAIASHVHNHDLQHYDNAQLIQASQDLSSQQGRQFQEYTLAVLFAMPIVGKDVEGKYHPIEPLDIKSEYSVLQKTLVEASTIARHPDRNVIDSLRSKTDPPFQAGDIIPPEACYQYPKQINMCAKFATTDNFRSLVTIGCRAMHFSGHGDAKQLYFEDGMGLVHPITHISLQQLFSAGGICESGMSTVRLAFVSACSSAPLAHAFVSCGIPHVIGVRPQEKIEDYAAIEFTRSFYLAIASGKSVGASFHIAQQAVANSANIRAPQVAAQKFFLLPEDGDHSEIIFPPTVVPPDPVTWTFDKNRMKQLVGGQLKPKKYPKLWFDDLPAICQGFCNRAIILYKICATLMMTQTRIARLVSIIGEEGIGKTTVAYAVVNYVGPRMTCEGGVRLFSVSKLAEAENEENINRVTHKFALSNSKSRVLSRLETMVKDALVQQRPRMEYAGQPIFIILDGCEFFQRSELRRKRFRGFLSELLTSNSCLKIIITSQTALSSDGAVPGHGDRVFQLARFNPQMSSKMLLSLIGRPIRLDELKRSSVYQTNIMKQNTTGESLPPMTKTELISSHPVLLATEGIPKKIADLAAKLHSYGMDDIEDSTIDTNMSST